MDDLFFVLNGITGGYLVQDPSGRSHRASLTDDVRNSLDPSEFIVLQELATIGQRYAAIRSFVDLYTTPNFSDPTAQLNGRFLSAFCHGTDSTLLAGYRKVCTYTLTQLHAYVFYDILQALVELEKKILTENIGNPILFLKTALGEV